MSANVSKKNMIYNPLTNKMVNRDTDLGEKLAEFKEQGTILFSLKYSLGKFIRDVNPEFTDKEFSNVYANLPEEFKFVLDNVIPSEWKRGLKYDLDKKPKKTTPSKLYSEYRKPILIQELDEDYDPKEISINIKSEWKKYSNKSRKNKDIFNKFTNLAKIENKFYDDRIYGYLEKHKNDNPKELSNGDKKKMEESPGDYELNEGTQRLNKIKKEKEQKKKLSKRQNGDEENDSEEEEEVNDSEEEEEEVNDSEEEENDSEEE